MKMSNKKFMKIAANLGISTALLTGCVGDLEENNSLAIDRDTTDKEETQKQCTSNQINENECFEEMPTIGPVKHEDKQNNPSVEHDNGWSSALVPFAAGAAGMMLINSLNKKNPGQINNNTNHTYRPPMTQRPLPEVPKEKEKEKGRGTSTSTTTTSGGGANKQTNNSASTNKNESKDKVNLNKSDSNKSNVPSPKTSNPTQSSKPSSTSKVTSGSSGIGNAKAPAGS
ncbi:lipoprotein [Bacillus cereus]